MKQKQKEAEKQKAERVNNMLAKIREEAKKAKVQRRRRRNRRIRRIIRLIIILNRRSSRWIR